MRGTGVGRSSCVYDPMLVWAVVIVELLNIDDRSEVDVFDINELRLDAEGGIDALLAREGGGGGTRRT